MPALTKPADHERSTFWNRGTQLPEADISETRLLRYLTESGVAVDGISYFYDRPSESPLGLLIGYATPPEHTYVNALDTFIDALADAVRPGDRRAWPSGRFAGPIVERRPRPLDRFGPAVR